MSNDVAPLLEKSIEIDAEPARVWALVTDLPRMAEWSPQVVKTIVRGGPIAEGSRTININRRGPLFWPTRAKVITFEPLREFAFRVKDNFTIWSFSLEETDSGTRVTQRRRTPDGTSTISNKLVDLVMGGQESFTEELENGMQQTLERLKADAEA